MTPIDIVNVLTAATPIVASVASIAKNNAENNERQNIQPTNINITINNHFYNNSEYEAVMKASKLQNDVIGGITSSGPRFSL